MNLTKIMLNERSQIEEFIQYNSAYINSKTARLINGIRSY